jgi:Bacterial Ig-like domain (group 3)
MHFRQSLAAPIAAAALVATSLGVSAATAQAATTAVTLPITLYSHMLVDPANQHLFITSGSGSSSILVTNYAGQTIATIPNEPGATGLALSSDGSTVYAALADGDAVSAISTSTLAETARYPTGTGTDPTYVAYTSGRIWFGYGAATQGGLGSIDPSTSPATVTLDAAPGSWYAAPMVTASAGGELVAGEPGQSPVQLASYDVSSGTATVLAPEEFFDNAANLSSMQITPDGQDVVIASGYPYYQQIYQVSDLSADGTYPTTNYPNSVSISSDGSVAAGTDAGSNEIFMFAPGGSTPLNTYDFGSDWLAADGAALTPDGSLLFAVTLAGGPTGAPTLNIIPDPEQAPSAPDPTTTAVTCSPGTIVVGQATSCTATVTDTASSGPTTPTGTVTFTSDTSGGTFSAGGSCTLSPADTGGQASCSLSYTPGQAGAGAQTITGNYGGDTAHVASSGSDVITVTLRATTTALTCQPVKLVLDQCTATVSDTSPGTATTPTGTVSFTSSGSGHFSATQCTLSGTGTSASCAVYYGTLAGVLMRRQTITASYGGDSTHQESTGSTTLR